MAPGTRYEKASHETSLDLDGCFDRMPGLYARAGLIDCKLWCDSIVLIIDGISIVGLRRRSETFAIAR